MHTLHVLLIVLHTLHAQMSWQAYIDQSLLGSKNVVKAAIHGHDGNPWATSAGFAVCVVCRLVVSYVV